ncbi:MAG: DUF4279 domain-containing protein [Candidatus Omnitrophica bacterium]|nr:DUF4279 domain-containing protein [Candidatus Omnitrophota bacterium]
MARRKKPIVDICFRVWGDNLVPEKVTNILNIKPTETFIKGERVSKNPRIKALSKTGKWFLKTNKHVNSNIVNDHIEFILSLLRKIRKPLHKLKMVDHLSITFIIGIPENADSVEFDLSPVLLKEIAQKNIMLSYDII